MTSQRNSSLFHHEVTVRRRTSMRSVPQIDWCFDLGLPNLQNYEKYILLLMSYPSWYFVIATQIDWGLMAELMAHNFITVLNQLLISCAFLVFSCLAWANTYIGCMPQLSIFSSASTYIKQPEQRTQLGILGTNVSSVTSVSHPTRLLSICFLFHRPSAHGNLSFALSQQMIVSPHLPRRYTSVGSR